MFRRRWSGLPADPVFAADLKELGYFINDVDEIRSIEDSDYYFKYFLTKNARWNERQRFAFNDAVTKIIRTRLTTTENFTTVPLPLGTPPSQPHVPIMISPKLSSATRVVLLVGEPCQSLGVLAHRVICGRGGITRGSVLGLVQGLKAQQSSAADPAPPGVVLANTGELWWWPEGTRGLTPIERHQVPMSSAVNYGRRHDPKTNEVPGNRTVAEHVKGVFEAVVMGNMLNKEAKVDVIAVGDAADVVEAYLDDDKVWEKVGGRLGCLVVMGGFYSSANFKCEGFRQFMKERARAYIIHHTPLDTPIAGSGGNPGAAAFTSYGCPVYSAGDTKVTETMLIDAQPAVLSWIQRVALEGDVYKNEEMEIFGEEGTGITAEALDSPWTDAAEENGTQANEKEEVKVPDSTAKGGCAEARVQDNPSVKAADNGAKTGPKEAQIYEEAKADVKKVEGGESEPRPSPAGEAHEAEELADLAKRTDDVKIVG
ncbi:hypothetical protein C8A03DRAFT_32764 [Achaetomium macrosporum]|uniref:Arb2 domain-containing protein n=1 Tax=Achaetomium macrosporum TaxID=79813 RepID=A0AAN7HG60_9PEZI|nr:hypothetical protein C8A03DRAFT_32764 [Achaetomium macrosporum]